MKKVWYVIGIIVAAALLSFFPRFVGQGEDPLWVGPVVSQQVQPELPTDCRVMGAPAGHDYHGWPLLSYKPNGTCHLDRHIYVGSVLINTLIAAGAGVTVWIVTRVAINRRSKS